MEIELGTKIVVVVDKNIKENDGTIVFVPKGTTGYVCDIEYINSGIVMVQFFKDSIIAKGTGVYSYKTDEIKIYS